jgi:predicted metal-dependent phosphotriesterase family hydrolase
MDKLKTVATFADPMLASIAEGLLQSNGIEAGIFGEVSSYPSLNAAEQNIQLKVNAEDYESALSILAASDKAE